jgi:hypothetical protein
VTWRIGQASFAGSARHNHRAMKHCQRLTSIWSLGRRAELTVRVHYRIRRLPARQNPSKTRDNPPASCSLYELKRVEEMEP